LQFACRPKWVKNMGTYVLQDNKFALLTQFSNGKQYLEEAPKYLAFSCGLIRGALSNLGLESVVTAEVSLMPSYIMIK
uniref:Trafficking protein particle complex 6b-like n=1 Tax=Cyprinus carpio TaxID=7962 RepID=A0A8C2F7L6_CYPCA